MTRARSLSRLANSNAFTVDASNRVGIGSTQPDVRLDVNGDMNVTGTLTYEDVTNVETAGITTTGGLVVTGLGATIGGITTFFGDLNFGAAGVGGTITTLGHAEFAGVVTATSFSGDGSALTGVASTENINTSTLAQFTGPVGIADSIFHIGDSNTAIRFPAADTFTVETGGGERVRVFSDASVRVGDNTIAVAAVGAGPTFAVNGAAPEITLRDSATNNPYAWMATNDNGSLILAADQGGNASSSIISFNVDGSQKGRITGDGRLGINTDPGTLLELTGRSGEEAVVTFNREGVQGTADGTIGRLIYENHTDSVASIDVLRGGANDEAYIRFATQNESGSFGERVRIHQNGNVGIATTNPLGKLSLLADDTQDDPDIVFQASSGIGLAHAALSTTDDSGGADLMVGSNFYLSTNGNETRFNTGRSGSAVRFGYSGTMRFYTNSGSNAPTERLRITNAGRVGIATASPDGAMELHVGASSGVQNTFVITRQTTANYAAISFKTEAGGTIDWSIGQNDAGDFEVFHAGADAQTAFTIKDSGSGAYHVLPGGDNDQDLGSSSLRWANIYSADLQLSNEGSSNDVDGTWGQYTIQEGENDLFLLNRRNGKTYKFVLEEVN